jgi:tellurite resistance protein
MIMGAGSHRHNDPLAANKHIITRPDVTAVKVMLSALLAAVDSTIEKRPVEEAACFARRSSDLSRFFAAMINCVRGPGSTGGRFWNR